MRRPTDSDGAPERHTGADRLDSWKEIADYLRRDVRTVQRWEKSEDLPVHRHVHEKTSSVYAYQSELEAWLAGREESDAHGERHETETTQPEAAAYVPAGVAPPARRRAQRAWGMAAVGVLAIALVWAWAARRESEVSPSLVPATNGPPSWILVSEFEGPPDDADLAAAVRELVVASLTNSEVVTPISRAQMKRGLQLAMRPDTTVVAGEVARELASRASARAYVEGRIDRIQNGYSIVLHILDAETSEMVASVRGVAEHEGDLIATLDQLGRDLRERIGEKGSRVRAHHPFVEAITPSFDAYRKHVQQTDLHLAGDHRSSLRLAREALDLDPDFALAHLQKGTTYSSLGMLDSAEVAWREALRRPNRLTEMQQLNVRALMAVVLDRDLDEFIRLQTLLIQQHRVGYNNLGVALGLLGRYDDALTAFERAGTETPFGAEQLHLANQFNMSLRVGRVDEARGLLPRLDGNYRRSADLTLALAESKWQRADRIASAHQADDTTTPLMRYWARQARASIAAVRGDVGGAEAALEGLIDEAPNPPSASATRFALVHLRAMRAAGAHTQPPAPEVAGVPTDELVSLGVACAARGDTSRAREYLRDIESRPPRDARRYATDILVLRAAIAAASERWDEVLELLEPFTLRGPEPNFTGRLPIRWLVGDAFEHTQRFERAAEAFELAISAEGLVRWWSGANEIALRGLTEPFARLRLVSLYTRLGRFEQAQKHWRILEQSSSQPDPEFEVRLHAAREQVEALASATP